MENILLNDRSCSIYPGSYVPLIREEAMQNKFRHLQKKKTVVPVMAITEIGETYKLEMTIPEARREDFFVHAYGNILSISIMHKETEHRKKERSQLRGFRYGCFDRQIILPNNADTEFISAEYLSGILRLYIPKMVKPAGSRYTKIAVY